MDILKDIDTFEFIGDYVRITKIEEKPSVFCFPEWASHITSHARLKLHQAMVQCNPVYVDTDSMFTRTDIPCSDKLGDLKLEMRITEGFLIKPKFYCLIDDKNNEHIKIKGVHKKIIIEGADEDGTSKRMPFQKIIDGERVDIITSGFQKSISVAYLKDNIIDGNLSLNMLKFMKFREAIRRDKIPNEIVPILKILDLEDTKRHWHSKFDIYGTQESSAINTDVLNEIKRVKQMLEDEKRNRRNNELIRTNKKKELNKFIHSDLFDLQSVGKDITADEFIENEKFFALHD
jgi:hypothetical protein